MACPGYEFGGFPKRLAVSGRSRQLPRHPIVTIPGVVKLLETTKPTAAKAVGVLEDISILEETTGRRRDRTFSCAAYLDRLRAGTDLEES